MRLDCSDDELLNELNVIVGTGWDLPARPGRWHAVRHLLTLANPDDALRPAQAAHRLLELLDRALVEADPEVLLEDDALGCRILLGVHPTYRTVSSAVRRRVEAAAYLVPKWQKERPRDPAGSFQRRHQRTALRLVLQCLRNRYDRHDDDDAYDVARIQRLYVIDGRRQVAECRDVTHYRMLEDGVDRIDLIEFPPEPEGLVDSSFVLETVGGEPPPTVAALHFEPALRANRITLQLPRPHEASEIVQVAWRQTATYDDCATDWGRYWTQVLVGNDHFELTMSLQFADDVDLPDLCWWYSADPMTDLGEIGPAALDRFVDLRETRGATHTWPATETTRRRAYGFIWCWFDGHPQPEWEALRAQLPTTI